MGRLDENSKRLPRLVALKWREFKDPKECRFQAVRKVFFLVFENVFVLLKDKNA
jgi:hypothetical protein